MNSVRPPAGVRKLPTEFSSVRERGVWAPSHVSGVSGVSPRSETSVYQKPLSADQSAVGFGVRMDIKLNMHFRTHNSLCTINCLRRHGRREQNLGLDAANMGLNSV